jgi:hypothetical protein
MRGAAGFYMQRAELRPMFELTLGHLRQTS